ncbi:MAG: hypothetical protein JW818_20135 [Pirellulales bacterium]|nr:hypothetical protein [Pirellulales bacterium]
MKVLIAVTVCVVIDDDGNRPSMAARSNPLDDLIARMRREMQHGRDSVRWSKPDGAKVA